MGFLPTLFFNMAQRRTEFAAALQSVATERGLEPAVVLETVKQAILAAFRRDARERGDVLEEDDIKNLEVEISPDTGEARVFKKVIHKQTDQKSEKAERRIDITPPGFGRIAAQTAKQVILQRIREAEKDTVLSQYQQRVGNLVSGNVLRFDGSNVRVDLGRIEAVMPHTERIPNEKLTANQRLTFLLKEIRDGERGREIILSRADPAIVEKLFAREVPEVASGAIEIKALVRIPGVRTKVAVASSQPGVDPVGSCVGQKGVRVQAVINELNNEKIDVIPWTEDVKQLINFALSPAEHLEVKLDEKKKEAIVQLPEDQLSLAIGSEGQNIRLASKLTGWKIEVKGIKKKADGTSKKSTKAQTTEKQAKKTNAESLAEEKKISKLKKDSKENNGK